NLEPLRGLPLKWFSGVGAVDLSPLAGMPLETLTLPGNSGYHEADVLRTTRSLKTLSTGWWPINRVGPLAKLPLTQLHLSVTMPRDLHLLKDMKSLESIQLSYDESRHRDALRAMTWLKSINGKPPVDFWKEIAEQQAEFVRREMKRLNPTLVSFETN